jgi:trehalose/maltose hydrolase-like predicted phosphorylase
LQSLRFALEIRGQELEVEIGNGETVYRLRKGQGLSITHQGQVVALASGMEVRVPVTMNVQE